MALPGAERTGKWIELLIGAIVKHWGVNRMSLPGIIVPRRPAGPCTSFQTPPPFSWV